MTKLDKDQIEKYLLDRMNGLTQKYLDCKTESLGKFSSSLVEIINDELPNKCPSVEGFKYVVHATVQVGWSQSDFCIIFPAPGQLWSGKSCGRTMSVGSRQR